MTFRDTTVDAVTTTTLPDAELQVAFGMDEEAFRGFYDRTSRVLWVYLSRMTGDRHLADDLLQEAYYRFLRVNAALESESHRRHYLFRIATNLVRDGHRRTRTRPVAALDDDVAATQGLAGADTAVDRRLDLSRALSKLGVKERALLWLAYAQGATHQEIAAAVGVKRGSVKPLLYRARRKLAALLGGDGGDR